MNIVHLVVVKNSFYNSESGRTIRKSAHFSLILGTKNLVNIGTQQHTIDNNSSFGSQKWPSWAKKAQNEAKIRPELNSLNTGNAIRESYSFI